MAVCTKTSSSASMERVPDRIRRVTNSSAYISPNAVAIGPYHRGDRSLDEMDEAKSAAVDCFCRGSGQSREAVRNKICSVAGNARGCYADESALEGVEGDRFAEMMLLDGCFLLQFIISMCPDDPDAPPDQFMSMAAVHTRIEDITRDVMLLENQIPWLVLQALMEFRTDKPVPVDRFLALMATAFDVGNKAKPTGLLGGDPGDHEPPPPHLLGLFHRRQVGEARTQDLRTPRLSSMSCTAVELTEMGVKLTASKTTAFGDMGMRKRRGRLGIYGELSLAPLSLDLLTACWLVNMAAYELGAGLPDNYAVGSYLSLLALLMNRGDDVRELREKGIIRSTLSDKNTLGTIKVLGSRVRVGHRYNSIFQGLEEYRKERWLWIVVHRFFYNNFKAIVTVLSIVGVLAGIFKTLLSLKQRPH